MIQTHKVNKHKYLQVAYFVKIRRPSNTSSKAPLHTVITLGHVFLKETTKKEQIKLAINQDKSDDMDLFKLSIF